MGVKLLLRAHPQKGGAGPAHHELIKRVLDELCCSLVRSDSWSVSCNLMKQGHGVVGSMGGPAAAGGGSSGLLRDMWAVAFRDSPELVYLLVRPEFKALECDIRMVRLIEKKLEYAKQMTVRLEGSTYTKGDLTLRLCAATQAIHSTQALLGYCLDLEYAPVSAMGAADGLVSEFVELLRQQLQLAGAAAAAAGGGALPGLQLEVIRPAFEKYGLMGQPYGRTHAAVAYNDLVVAMISSSAAAAQQAQQQTAAAAAQQAQQTQAAAGAATAAGTAAAQQGQAVPGQGAGGQPHAVHVKHQPIAR
ncbi:hypothetical protein HYH02_010084 [Chlamydomonas schloesseri]|uniref:Mediator of RNA polymerase II transcription subunit 20 n=1 Tax=Chlamydomonas schloesseri TaxID=2026947 RepID=A0A835TBY8_9CHLO|nr:hypothetical protein HYH02_010084 [Chlamydomonas schloesseri]|eukprot:KAG2441241.1 hypothetical protein HYH02_010084 [Chlamydomonas schloesseri]